MNEDIVARDMRKESLATLSRIESDPNLDSMKQLPLFVNGVEYPPIEETINSCKQSLVNISEPVMVFSHGDEHFENIISDGDDYCLIDPRKSGMISPSQIINSIAGMHYLVLTSYESTSSVGNKLDIRSKETHPATQEIANWLGGLIDYLPRLHPGKFLVREYLFTNLLRGFTSKVKESNISRLHPDRNIYIALANQIYYGDLIK